MKKIVDVRFRPPVGGFLKMAMFEDRERTARMGRPMNLELAPSVLKGSMGLLIEEMDTLGNYVACVSGLKRWRGAKGWIENEEVHEIVRKYPNRFVGLGGIEASDRRKALDDVDKCLKEYGFKGIIIEPGNNKELMYADDRRLYPIYSKCADMGIPVFLVFGGYGGPDVGYSEPARVERVAVDMPELRIVVLHGAWPWVTQMIRVAFRRPNVFIAPDMYITFPGSEQFIAAVNSNLENQFLYSTAYPFAPVVGFYEKFKGLGFKAECMDKIVYKNAEGLLHLT